MRWRRPGCAVGLLRYRSAVMHLPYQQIQKKHILSLCALGRLKMAPMDTLSMYIGPRRRYPNGKCAARSQLASLISVNIYIRKVPQVNYRACTCVLFGVT